MTAIARDIRNLVSAVYAARPEILVLVPVYVGLFLRLRKAWADIPTIVLEATSDDAYYYFQIARNIATGHNVTFDGETLTNGFHPLWMIVLTPLYLFSDDQDLPIHLGLTLASLLSAGTVFFVYAIVRTLTGNVWASLAGASFYAFHPYLIVESVNGMETALTVFMVAMTTWLFLRIACRSERTSLVQYGELGLSAGLMVLARTDTVFILPLMLLFMIVRERGWQRLTSPLATGGLALLVIAPWAIWSLVSFGTIVQVSGVAIADIERQKFLAAHGSSFLTQLDHAWDITRDAFFVQLPRFYLVSRHGPRLPILLALGGFLAAMLLAPLAPQRRQATRQIGLLLIPTVGIVSALLFHTAIRWHVRGWYFAPMALVGAAFLGIVVNYLHGVLRGTHLGWRTHKHQDGSTGFALPVGSPALGRWRRLAILALYGMVALALVIRYGPQRSEHWVQPLPHRLNALEAAYWLKENTQSEARIGSFNAGIIGYFSDRTVINLDGVVNEEAYEARRDGRLMEYVQAKDIQYLVDLHGSLAFARVSENGPPSFSLLTTIGEKVYYFGGGRLDVMVLVPEAGATSSRCAGVSSDSGQDPGLTDQRQ
jgi:hypothetical protein